MKKESYVSAPRRVYLAPDYCTVTITYHDGNSAVYSCYCASLSCDMLILLTSQDAETYIPMSQIRNFQIKEGVEG